MQIKHWIAFQCFFLLPVTFFILAKPYDSVLTSRVQWIVWNNFLKPFSCTKYLKKSRRRPMLRIAAFEVHTQKILQLYFDNWTVSHLGIEPFDPAGTVSHFAIELSLFWLSVEHLNGTESSGVLCFAFDCSFVWVMNVSGSFPPHHSHFW